MKWKLVGIQQSENFDDSSVGITFANYLVGIQQSENFD